MHQIPAKAPIFSPDLLQCMLSTGQSVGRFDLTFIALCSLLTYVWLPVMHYCPTPIRCGARVRAMDHYDTLFEG